jgi:hypothetical protein
MLATAGEPKIAPYHIALSTEPETTTHAHMHPPIQSEMRPQRGRQKKMEVQAPCNPLYPWTRGQWLSKKAAGFGRDDLQGNRIKAAVSTFLP